MGKIIAYDTDDVIFPFTQTLIEYYNQSKKFNPLNKKLTLENFSANLEAMFGMPTHEVANMINLYYKSKYFLEASPIQETEIIANLSGENDQYVITSRPNSIKEETEEFYKKYFNHHIKKIYFSKNHYIQNGADKDKFEIMRDIKADIIIEDIPKYLEECKEILPDVTCLLRDQPWNRYFNENKHNIIRINSLKEITMFL